ncbi:MAG: ABC transporter ATP-binding protein [Eubacteriales bacterium]|nr:ABC transporter ATP-binding protein [Eubacteriales bacterium]
MEPKKGNVLTRTFRIAAQGKAALILSCIASMLGMASGVLPYLSVYQISRLLIFSAREPETASLIMRWAFVALAGILAKTLLSFIGGVGCHRVAFKLLYAFRMKVMEHIGRLPMGFFGDNTTGGIQKIMDENIEKIEGFIAHMLPDITGSAVVVFLLLTALFRMNIILALAVILSVAAAFGFQVLVFGGKRVRQIMVDAAVSSQNVTSAFSEYMKGIAEIKLFGQAGSVTRDLEDNLENYRKWELRVYKHNSPPYVAYKTIVISMLTIILPAGILLLQYRPGAETVLAVLMALILTPAIYDPLMLCVNYGTQMSMLSVCLDDIDNILAQEPIPTPRKPQSPERWDVQFQDVSFSYQDASDPLRRMALKHITFTASQGKVTALVGPSGGGKSTIGQLLSRFWDVEQGCISIGGVNIRQIDPEWLMEQVSIVFQDTFLFSDTVRGNITMNREYSEEQIIAAAKAAQCHQFILELPQGYDTRIDSGGQRLSGGEAQRLSIARAILKDSPIVVLDEALAYSDAENENLIHQAIHNLLKDRTVLMIAHRLQSIRDADEILVLRNGEIIERGTHRSLMAEETEYRTLWNLQHEADRWNLAGSSLKGGGSK